MAVSADNLKKFLVDLSGNPKAQQSLRNDPNAYLDTTSLSPEEKSLVLSGDPVQIRNAISGSTLGGEVVVVVVVVIAV